MKLWSGRFRDTLDPLAERMNASLSVDRRLAAADIQGSLAWARALCKAGTLNHEELDAITIGLTSILEEMESGQFEFQDTDEDIHTAVERRLSEKIGPTAGKLHTGRSRNDQVATDFRIWMMELIPYLDELARKVQSALVIRSEKDFGAILPGYTHLQQAQPILLSHWWLWGFWMLERDRKRLQNLSEEISVLPLGCGALAGTGLPIDRFALAEDLGFTQPSPNSLDAVSDRDFVAGFLFWASMVALHLGKLAEMMILFSTKEFGFIRLADAYSTGSSLMPQKKNPDLLELTRAQSGVLLGLLTGALAVLKALPSAYDKDLQEDKAAVFAATDRLLVSLPVFAGMLETLEVDWEVMAKDVDPQVYATDLADYLVRAGVPFREAHAAVGKVVRIAQEKKLLLMDVPLEIWKQANPAFNKDLFELFNLDRSVGWHSSWGGTAPKTVEEQLALAKKILESE